MSAAAKIFGYQTGELLGRTLDSILPHRERRMHHRLISSSSLNSAQRIAGNRTLYGLHKAGNEVPIELNVSPMTIGKTKKFVGILRDVSSRIEADSKILQFKAAVDNALDCVFMFDPETLKFIYVNLGAVQQVGYSVEELLTMTPVDIKPNFSEEEFRAMIAPVMAGGSKVQTFQTVHRHKNGTDIPVEISLQYIDRDPDHPRFVAFVRDISERLVIEQVIRQREQTLRSVLNTSAASIVLLSEDGRIQEVNETWNSLFEQEEGAGPQAWEGENYLQVVGTELLSDPEDHAATEEALTKILDGRLASWEHIYLRKDQYLRRWFKMFCRRIDGVFRHPLRHHALRHHRGRRGAGETATGDGGGEPGQPGQEQVPGDHEPRDPDADEWDHRHGGSFAGNRTQRRTAEHGPDGS